MRGSCTICPSLAEFEAERAVIATQTPPQPSKHYFTEVEEGLENINMTLRGLHLLPFSLISVLVAAVSGKSSLVIGSFNGQIC
jgi:hypothetical protein